MKYQISCALAVVCVATAAASGSDWKVLADGRLFSNDNFDFSFDITRQTSWGNVGVSAFILDNTGPDPVLGSLQRSEISLFGVHVLADIWHSEDGSLSSDLAVEVGVDFVDKFQNTDIPTGTISSSDEAIYWVALPFRRHGSDQAEYWLRPTVIVFDDDLDLSTGGTIAGYSTVFSVEMGAEVSAGEEWTYGFIANYAFTGGNGIRSVTGGPTRLAGYEVWLAYQRPDSTWQVRGFLTNLAGPTAVGRVLSGTDTAVGVALTFRK